MESVVAPAATPFSSLLGKANNAFGCDGAITTMAEHPDAASALTRKAGRWLQLVASQQLQRRLPFLLVACSNPRTRSTMSHRDARTSEARRPQTRVSSSRPGAHTDRVARDIDEQLHFLESEILPGPDALLAIELIGPTRTEILRGACVKYSAGTSAPWFVVRSSTPTIHRGCWSREGFRGFSLSKGTNV
jgi:hypothetical protein